MAKEAKVTKIFLGKIKSVDKEKKTIKAVVSDQTIDRYGEVILASAYKSRLTAYKSNPILLSSHSYGSLRDVIGKAESIVVDGKELVAEFSYFTDEGNSEADWAWKLASKYDIAAFSVGFIPFKSVGADWEKDGDEIMEGKVPRRTYTDVELIEVSQVTVPANPNALGKSFEDDPSLDDTSKAILKEYFSVISKEFKVKEEIKEVVIEEDAEVDELKKMISEFIKDYEAFKKEQSERMIKLLEFVEKEEKEKEEIEKIMEDVVEKEMEETEKNKKDAELKEVEDAEKKQLEEDAKEIAELIEKEKKEALLKAMEDANKKLKELLVKS